MRRLIRLPTLVTIISALLGLWGEIAAQAPTLNPEQTVNTATGSMGFALPLGVVKGNNGHDFPVNLYYQAGIKYTQEASPAGLGFSYDVGTISRKEVFVNDDAKGGSGYYDKHSTTYNSTLSAIMPYVRVIITIASYTAGFISGGGIFMAFLQPALSSLTSPGPGSFLGGGTHNGTYQGTDGAGFFRGGEKTDLPDMYFINSPFLSGQMVWEGNPQNGHFVLKSSGGSTYKDKETVQIIRHADNNEFSTFEIILADGTRLFFEKYDQMSSEQYMYVVGCIGASQQCEKMETHYYESVPQMWRMTKILFSDYSGGENPSDPASNAKGNWICFKYDSIYGKICKPWMLQQAASSNGSIDCPVIYSQVGTKNGGDISKVKLFFLDSIKTPNETAEYNYVLNRKDDLWYDRNNSYQPVAMPVLDNVVFRDKQRVQKKKVVLNTTYLLRKQTLSAHAFPQAYVTSDGNPQSGFPENQFPVVDPLHGVAGNPEVRCLTLTSLDIFDAADNKSIPVIFNYNSWWEDWIPYFRFNGISIWDGWQGCNGFDTKHYYIELRDMWGYFRGWTAWGLFNAWNERGVKDQTCIPNSDDVPWAEAWSMNSVNLPNGLTIEWKYESNQYDAANGQPVASENGKPRYTGGIRVKKVIATDGQGKSNTWSYFYTSENGTFDEETGGCSGYATVEPVNYIATTDYRTSPTTRGGLYTPSLVGYEKVQVVKNYNATLPHAPYGYAVYEFTHSGDPTQPCYYPNSGGYGEKDYSWKRGLPWRTTVRSSNDKIISQQEMEYGFIQQNAVELVPDTWLFDLTFEYERDKNTFGWIYLKSKTETVNGTSKKTVYKYAIDTKTADYVVDKCAFKIFKPWEGGGRPPISRDARESGGAWTIATQFGSDNSKMDYLIAAGNWNINLYFGTDVPENSPYTTWATRQIDLTSRYDDPHHVIGASFVDLEGGNNKNDLIILHVDYWWDQVIGCVLLKNVSVSGSTIVSDEPVYKKLFIENNFFTDGLRPVSAVCGQFDNSPLPDILFLEGDDGETGRTGNRKILGAMNVDFVNLDTAPAYYSSSAIPSLSGDRMTIVDDDKNGVPDIEITGSGYTPHQYHGITNTILHNVDPQSGPKTLNFGTITKLPNSFTINKVIGKHLFWDFYYLGMCRQLVDGNEKHFFGMVEPASDQPNLIIVKMNTVPDMVEGDLDGQPNEVWTTAPGNKWLVTKTIPAYWKNPLMRINEGNEPHMLAQPCQTIVYEKAVSDNTPLSDADVRSSQVITWNYWGLPNYTWLPQSTYSWNVPRTQAGVPTVTFSDFNFASPPPQPNVWQLTGTIDKYDAFSTPLQTTNAKGISSTTVYRNDLHLPIGSIANATFKECGVFTGDYDLSAEEAGYFDHDNGWEKPSTGNSLSDIEKHFSDKSVKVENWYGPTRNFVVTKDKNYVMSAWVKVTSGTLTMKAEYRNGVGGMSAWPIPFAQLPDPLYASDEVSVTSAQASNWTLVKLNVNASTKLNAATGYIRAWVGTKNSGVAYIDDIRFHPAKSLVSTTYYDSKWQQPILSVDATNNPGRKVVYDDFGRPVQWYKFDKTNPANLTPVQSKEYHLMSDWYKPDPTKWYKIVYAGNEGYCIDIKDRSWTEGQMVHLWSIQTTNDYNQQWKFVPAGDYYKIVSRGGSGTDYRLSNPGALSTSLVIGTANTDNQQWTMTDAGGGSCRIASKANSTYLVDLDGGNVGGGGVGGKVQMYVNGQFTKWKMVEVP